MILVSLVLLIRGIFKKNKTLWISSLAGGTFFTLLIFFSITSYISNEIEYWGSEEHRKESFNKAKNIGKSLGGQVTGVAQGIIESVDEDAIIELARKSAKIVGKGITAIGEGFNGFEEELKILTDESVSEMGLIIGYAQKLKKDNTYSLGIFIEYEQNFKGSLVLTTFDIEGKSLNKSIFEVNRAKGEEKLEIFQFKILEPIKTGYCILKVITL
jgi:hypothetical protein